MQLGRSSVGFLVSSFSILLCIFVTEWSRIDQDDQSDLVFSFGLDYQINFKFDIRSAFTCRVSLSDDLGP